MTEKTKKRNVLLICADHWPASFLGVAGHPVIKTPGLDELALSGTRFTNCYSECPVCIPARRSLMTGTPPKSHGDRTFNEQMKMPSITSLPQAFRNAGYQADAVGKLHVFPQRDRIGFDSVVLDEEGRQQFGVMDDYDIFLGDQGYAGRQFDHGMSTNQYSFRAWHLDEYLHPTNWAARNMSRQIKRRDPTKPAFWYLGFRHPHPPLVPLQNYLDQYKDVQIDEPIIADWIINDENIPFPLKELKGRTRLLSNEDIIDAKKAFFALCTHIDHQIRWVIGTLRDENILDDTIIVFMSDHGDMLGTHKTVAKRVFYENSSNIPMIISGVDNNELFPEGGISNRLMGLQDVMPTLLELCGIEIPTTVDGLSMASEANREYLYGEYGEGDTATRMIRKGNFKLIYYPVGNHTQLFNLKDDPYELRDLAREQSNSDTISEMVSHLRSELYGSDLKWIKNNELVGIPDKEYLWKAQRNLHFQRGEGWPPNMNN